jgi:hypothetical protein
MQSVRYKGLCVVKDKLVPFKHMYDNYLELTGTFISRSSQVPI